jgi:hypothetical protein
MMRSILGNRTKIFLSLMTLFTLGVFQFAGIVTANNTPQTLPFSQNWSNIGLITVNDDWSAVPGIVGFLGNYDAASPTNIDPRTLLAPFTTNDVDVIANQTNPDANISGGVAEFEITNPTIALQGSGTADAPHIVIYLNTTGRSNIIFAANIRDIDGSADDAAQQVDVQYRVGGTGNWTSVPGGYIADATTAGTATQVTALNLTLPANANNQALVEIRVITTNAAGSDEWIGVDDINITGTTTGGGTPTPVKDAPVDFNGDGKTDYAVIRNVGGATGTGGVAPNQARWFYNINGAAVGTVALDFGLFLPIDIPVPVDYDGDGKDDIAVWRATAAANVGAFYILNSATNTVRIELFGQQGDDPTVVGDYTGDGKADLAVYRAGATPGAPSTWFYRASPNGQIAFIPWGVRGDFPAPGDYDGDKKNDFVILRSNGTGQSGAFWTRLATGVILPVQSFGLPTDYVVPGDYDGDGKTDLATIRNGNGALNWYWKRSSDQLLVGPVPFGFATTATEFVDFPVQGDYDGDGRTDVAVWRKADGLFITRSTGTKAISFFKLGASGDFPVAFYNVH